MRTRALLRQVVVTTAVVLSGLGLVNTGVAAAEASTQPPAEPGSVTVTLSPEQVEFLCQRRLPRLADRVERLLDRIQGGPEVRGSVAWLTDLAERERAAGRETTASLLAEAAERRAGWVSPLRDAGGRIAAFQQQYCGGDGK